MVVFPMLGLKRVLKDGFNLRESLLFIVLKVAEKRFLGVL